MREYLLEVLALARGGRQQSPPKTDETEVEKRVRAALDRIPQIVAAAERIDMEWLPLLKIGLGDDVAAEAASRLVPLLQSEGIRAETRATVYMADASRTTYVFLSSLLQRAMQ